MWYAHFLLLLGPVVSARSVGLRQSSNFVPASDGPVNASPSYGNPSNGPLTGAPVVSGQVFDRFITLFLENTDFNTAAASPVFQSLAQQGILLNNYHGLSHPSQPNYIASVGGDFFGLADDNPHSAPSNVRTVVDLLEAKNISWASYQESMLGDGDTDATESIPNYVTGSSSLHKFYVRKHNPLISYDSVATAPARASLIRNFNDFAADFNASVLPQWFFVTPNLSDDGHDTDQNWIDSWLNFWLVPLLSDSRFNDNRTLIMITYDEDESRQSSNQVFGLLLGGAVPTSLQGTQDNTYFTHYSLLSTVEVNWSLGCLGRNDANTTMANVFSFVASATNYTNMDVPNPPDTSLSGVAPGPLNPNNPTPWPDPDPNAACPGGGSVLV